MREPLKKLIDGTPLYHVLRTYRSRITAPHRKANWQRRGRPVPPPDIVKQETVKQFAIRFGITTLVETGTYQGDMVQAVKRNFEKVYSIELGINLAERAKNRFMSDRHITIIQGDSAAILARLVPTLSEPALFWLDAHYSGGITARGKVDTPILQELAHILRSGGPDHVILVDDARLFGVDEGYPTLNALTAVVRARAPEHSISIIEDCIRILPDAAKPS